MNIEMLATPTAELLDATAAFLQRFCVLSDPQVHLLALWTLHTYIFELFPVTPYLFVSSAEKQSGKTRVLEVIKLLVCRPWHVQGPSEAVLFRKISQDKPTILLDEVDSIFGKRREDYEGLRGALNAGFQAGAKIPRVSFEGKKSRLEEFDVFTPKCFAGLGTLPDTLADRSIPIRMKRRSKSEKIERFRLRTAGPEGREIQARAAAWAETAGPLLDGAEPVPPDGLSDRSEDAAEPLLAIADLAGGRWPQRARAALLELCARDSTEDQSKGVRLLADVRAVFTSRGTRVASVDLCRALNEAEEAAWATWNEGKGIRPVDLSKVLRPYGIVPKPLRIGSGVTKGYDRVWFEDTFMRLLPAEEEGGAPVTEEGSEELPF